MKNLSWTSDRDMKRKICRKSLPSIFIFARASSFKTLPEIIIQVDGRHCQTHARGGGPSTNVRCATAYRGYVVGFDPYSPHFSTGVKHAPVAPPAIGVAGVAGVAGVVLELVMLLFCAFRGDVFVVLCPVLRARIALGNGPS